MEKYDVIDYSLHFKLLINDYVLLPQPQWKHIINTISETYNIGLGQSEKQSPFLDIKPFLVTFEIGLLAPGNAAIACILFQSECGC